MAEVRDQLQVPLRLDVAAHQPERADQLAGVEEHPGDDRVERPPPGREPVRVPASSVKHAPRFCSITPVPGATTREPKRM